MSAQSKHRFHFQRSSSYSLRSLQLWVYYLYVNIIHQIILDIFLFCFIITGLIFSSNSGVQRQARDTCESKCDAKSVYNLPFRSFSSLLNWPPSFLRFFSSSSLSVKNYQIFNTKNIKWTQMNRWRGKGLLRLKQSGKDDTRDWSWKL